MFGEAVATKGDVVTTTGLLHVPNQQELYALGSTLDDNGNPKGLHAFNIPTASIYVVGLFDDGTKNVVSSGRA